MKLTPFLLITALGALGAARADIVIQVGPGDDRASIVGGFRIVLGDPGLPRNFSGEDKVMPDDKALLSAVTLTTRDIVSSQGNSAKPLYLKVYDSRERTRLLGVSTNALRWDAPGGVPLATEQTYTFDGLAVPTHLPLYFVLETDLPEKSPVGAAGIMLCTTALPAEYALMMKDLKDFAGRGVPIVTFALKSPPAEPGAGNAPVAGSAAGGPPYGLIGGAVGAVALAAGGVFFALRRRKPAAVPLPPAPSSLRRPPARGSAPLPPPPGR